MTVNSARRAPPKPEPRKTIPINAAYEDKAKALLRSVMNHEGVGIEELSSRLRTMGVEITPGGLANKISRGGFSASFLLQCMEAMRVSLDANREFNSRN
jgi:hypothetical protein